MIVDKLKKIVSTLGGSYTAKDDTVSELLEQINTAFSNGGGSVIVTLTETEPDSSRYTADKTVEEIETAFNAGKTVKVKFDEFVTSVIAVFHDDETGDLETIHCSPLVVFGGNVAVFGTIFYNVDGWKAEMKDFDFSTLAST